MLLIFLFALVVTYVWQINHQAQHGFSIRDLEDKKIQLEDTVRDLTWEVSSAQSLASISERAQKLELAAPVDVSYLKIGLSTVAVYDEISP
ncbi:MAG: hypothetical protein QF747_00080 [Patescibacteria group bacterium]|nr:hypothetical protein [Patescibacteria group bacterium]MDP6756223.1 hypothetical protein [Patescibacteria group bacterium]